MVTEHVLMLLEEVVGICPKSMIVGYPNMVDSLMEVLKCNDVELEVVVAMMYSPCEVVVCRKLSVTMADTGYEEDIGHVVAAKSVVDMMLGVVSSIEGDVDMDMVVVLEEEYALDLVAPSLDVDMVDMVLLYHNADVVIVRSLSKSLVLL